MEHTILGNPPRVNVIIDDRHGERYNQLLAEFKKQGINNYEFWPCKIRPSIPESICLSHKMIVQDAKDNGLKKCIIMEDDCFFPANDGWDYFLKNEPSEYDLYLACTYLVPHEQGVVNGFHLYIIHSKFYDKFLSIPDDVHVDTYMNTLKGDYKFCYPFPALQREGYSANNNAVVNYNLNLRDKDIYVPVPNV